MKAKSTIFVVDDQESIRSTLQGILSDVSYIAKPFHSAEELREALKAETPDLILLDIWLPGIDGVETLRELKTTHPEIPVILMSGHAGIEVAVNAMKAGASDFLEKPLNLDVLLDKIAQHLPVTSDSRKGNHHPGHKGDGVGPDVHKERGEVYLATSRDMQKTVRRNAVMNGVGLLSGRPTGIIISPLPVDSGIEFRTLDGVVIPAHIRSLMDVDRLGKGQFTANSTVLTKGGRRIRTVEHLLAALHMMGVTNASIKVDEEIPNIDGSAADFCKIIAEAGLEVQSAPRTDIVIGRKILIGTEAQDQKHIFAEPYDGFEVKMRVDYPAPIFEQIYRFNPAEQSFEEAIASARSFNTFQNIDLAQKQGTVGSGYLASHIIMHEGKVINTELKFPDEFVRHKILDLLGDLYLLGRTIRGRIVANMTSHGYNQALAARIQEALDSP